jgi:hypothetical protein
MADMIRDPLEHPLYRVAHLHGDRWVTLAPSQQHAPSEDAPTISLPDGSVYECPECSERIAVAPDGASSS